MYKHMYIRVCIYIYMYSRVCLRSRIPTNMPTSGWKFSCVFICLSATLRINGGRRLLTSGHLLFEKYLNFIYAGPSLTGAVSHGPLYLARGRSPWL